MTKTKDKNDAPTRAVIEYRCEHTDRVDPKTLQDHPKNPNKHPSKQIEALCKNIDKFGWRHPIVVSKRSGLVICGHARKQAAIKLECDAPVDYQDFDDDTAELAVLMADNIIPELASMDSELKISNLEEIKIADISLDIIGVEPIVSRDNVDAEPRVGDAKELKEKWNTERGQLWQLGDHRLLCGDSTSDSDVKRCIGDDAPMLMVTDPPYGVEYDPEWRNRAARHSNRMGNRCIGAGATGKVENDDRSDWTEAWNLFHGDAAYVWHAGRFASVVASSLIHAEFNIRTQIIWAKNQFSIGRGNYHWQHEPCWYAVRKGRKAHWIGDRKQTTLWEIDKPQNSETGHSTQKPIECMARPIRNHKSEFVYEPFCGSGTTVIACEQLGRKCRAIEISPEYIAVTLQRYLDATGKQPHQIKS